MRLLTVETQLCAAAITFNADYGLTLKSYSYKWPPGMLDSGKRVIFVTEEKD
jgi:hypothetical protein